MGLLVQAGECVNIGTPVYTTYKNESLLLKKLARRISLTSEAAHALFLEFSNIPTSGSGDLQITKAQNCKDGNLRPHVDLQRKDDGDG